MKRRDFLKLSGAVCASLASLSLDSKFVSRLSAATKAPDLPGSLGAKEVPSVCDMCFWRCPIVAKVKGGRVVKIEGNPLSPTNGTAVCARGNAGLQLLYDKDRLKYPMKRAGARGEGKWVRISWDEALDEIAENIKKVREKYGPHALALFDHGSSAAFFREIFEALGTENFSNEPAFFQCVGPNLLAYLYTLGYQAVDPAKVDMANAKVIILFGSHLGENIQVSLVKDFVEGLSRGAKLIVVDPRFSVAAGKADLWLPIRPGTDLALLLAWINYVIENDLYDHEFVKNHTYGFAELKKEVKGYTLSWAAKICDLPEEDIRQAIELLAHNKPHVCIHPGRHSAWYGSQDVQRHRAMAILTGLLGTVGVKGGFYFPTEPPLKKEPFLKKHGHEKVEPPEVSLKENYPFAELFHGSPTAEIVKATRTGKPYPIKLWGVCGVNIIQTIPNPYQTLEALKKLDFIFCVDLIPTESVLWADIVLPDATYLERYDGFYVGKEPRCYVALRQPAVKPLFESRPAFDIARDLAKRLGLTPKYEKVEDWLEAQLKPSGHTLKELKKTGLFTYPAKPYRSRKELSFDTDSGKFELYCEAFADEDFPGIPKPDFAPAPPKGYARLLYGRVPVHTFAKTMNNLWLHHEWPENRLWVNDEVAKRLELKDGDEVILENQDGYRSERPVKVFVTPGIRPDAVYLPHGFGSRSPMLKTAYGHGVSDTFLVTHYEQEPLMGASSHRNNFVRFIKDGRVLEIPEMRPVPKEIPRFEPSKKA